MPSRTKRQARTMAMAAHDPAMARKMGIAMDVAKEFNQADKGTGLLSKAMKKRKQRKAGKSKAWRFVEE